MDGSSQGEYSLPVPIVLNREHLHAQESEANSTACAYKGFALTFAGCCPTRSEALGDAGAAGAGVGGAVPADVVQAAGSRSIAAPVDSVASGSLRRPRSVRVVDVDRLMAQVQALVAQEEGCQDRVKAIEEQLAASADGLYGIDVLRAVAVHERYRLRSALQSILASTMEERPTTAFPASSRAGRQQSFMKFDWAFTRSGMDELADMQALRYEPVATRRNCSAVRTLQFSGSAQLLKALGFNDSVPKEYACRVLKRQRDDSHRTRVPVETHTDENGCVWYILGRNSSWVEIRLAVRESEQYSARLHDYVHPLVRRAVRLSDVPKLPERCPAFLAWLKPHLVHAY